VGVFDNIWNTAIRLHHYYWSFSVNEYEMDLRLEALEVSVKEMAGTLHEIERVIVSLLRVCDCPACRRRRAELAGRDEAPRQR
jgi:hypothetical protein